MRFNLLPLELLIMFWWLKKLPWKFYRVVKMMMKTDFEERKGESENIAAFCFRICR